MASRTFTRSFTCLVESLSGRDPGSSPLIDVEGLGDDVMGLATLWGRRCAAAPDRFPEYAGRAPDRRQPLRPPPRPSRKRRGATTLPRRPGL